MIGLDSLSMIPNRHLLRDLGVKLDPEKSDEKLIAIGLEVVDKNETYTLVVRRGVLDVTSGLQSELAARIEVNQTTLWDIISGKLDWLEGVDNGRITVKQGEKPFREFVSFLDD